MPIDLPNLDDIDYDDLVQQAVTAIPALYPGWTDENASDPGIALVELFAWLTDMLVYRTNRIPPDSYQVFVGLLNGTWTETIATSELPAAIERTLSSLQDTFRAVTTADYELLTTSTFQEQQPPAAPAIERVKCLGQRNLGVDPTALADGHVSLVVAADTGDPASPWDPPPPDLLRDLRRFFEPRRLITTQLHVTGPSYVTVEITATLYLESDATSSAAIQDAIRALVAYYHPWTGGADGKGWPFGRNVYVSEIGSVLSQVSGVSFVGPIVLGWADEDQENRGIPAATATAITAPAAGKPAAGATLSSATLSSATLPSPDLPDATSLAIVGLQLYPHELVQLSADHIHFTVEVLYGEMGQRGTTWQVPT